MRTFGILVASFAMVLALSACSNDNKTATPTTTTTSTAGASAASTTATTPNPAAVGSGEAYRPTIVPADFSTTIDNPFLPLPPGTRQIYEGDTEDGHERTVVEVTRDTKVIVGVTCVVVRDVVTLDGVVIEDTFDWYAQDRAGNVWYFGEDTKAYDGTKVSTHGSWEAGVDGAQPGIVMMAHPSVGDAYRQEYYAGSAEDQAAVLSTTATERVPFGAYDNLVQTKDFSELEPDVVEHKFYARDIGFILAVHVSGPAERIELAAVEQF